MSKPGRRVYVSVEQFAAHQQRARHRHTIDAERASWPITRRATKMSAAKSSVRCSEKDDGHVPCRKKTRPRACRRAGKRGGPDREDEGPERRPAGRCCPTRSRRPSTTVRCSSRRVPRPSAPVRCGAFRARSWPIWPMASPTASRNGWRSPASATAPRCRARTCTSRSATATTCSIRSRKGIRIATPRPTEIVVTGVDRQKVGQVAAEIRAFRPPEPYKGKGVKYAGEYRVPQGR